MNVAQYLNSMWPSCTETLSSQQSNIKSANDEYSRAERIANLWFSSSWWMLNGIGKLKLKVFSICWLLNSRELDKFFFSLKSFLVTTQISTFFCVHSELEPRWAEQYSLCRKWKAWKLLTKRKKNREKKRVKVK